MKIARSIGVLKTGEDVWARPIVQHDDARWMWDLYNLAAHEMTRNTRPWTSRDFEAWWATIALADDHPHWWGWLYSLTRDPTVANYVVGMGMFHPELGFSQPSVTVSVIHRWRNKGVGRLIYTHLAEQAVKVGFKFAWAEIRDRNVASWRAAERAGWTKVTEARVQPFGVRVRRYVGVQPSPTAGEMIDLWDSLGNLPGDRTSNEALLLADMRQAALAGRLSADVYQELLAKHRERTTTV